MTSSLARLSSILSFALLLGACGPQTLWQGGDISVERTSAPNIHKITQGEKELYYKVQDGMAYLDEHVYLGPVNKDGVLEAYLETQGSRRSDCIFWIFCPEFRWPQGIVPYTIHENVNEWQRGEIQHAIDEIHRTTRILLVPKEDHHKNYIRFVAGWNKDACSSFLGMKGGVQKIDLGKNGCHAASVQHEIGHALGLQHEHQRCDRAEHIKIHWGEMSLPYFFNFINLCFMGKDVGDYDPNSNMHYDAYAFSRTGKPTITLVKGGLPHPTYKFSPGDLATIEEIYAKEFEKRD